MLRHAHATGLINAGVSIDAVCRRLGHATTCSAYNWVVSARRRRDRVSS
ncbi:site-specific integrase [Nonomuraea turcica]